MEDLSWPLRTTLGEREGEGVLTEQKKKAVEKFICLMYKVDIASVDKARVVLFSKAGKPEALPPTSDALYLHTLRAHYQTLAWKQAHRSEPLLPDPVTMGWNRTDDNKLRPLVMTNDPIPKACGEIISCSCPTGCTTSRCSCKKSSLFCTSVCGCGKTANTNCCRNTNTNWNNLSSRACHGKLVWELRIRTKKLQLIMNRIMTVENNPTGE